MATLQLKVQGSRFVEHNGIEVKSFTPMYVDANGWKCYMNDNGNISCIAEQHYNGVRHTIKFNLKNNYVKLILKKGKDKPKVLKSYKLDKWPTDGVIGLPGGYIERRRAYFREGSFQEFLEKYALTAVRNEPAIGIYVLQEKFCNGESIYKEEVEITDGKAELIFNDVYKNENDEEGTFIIWRKVEVTNATWVIKKVMTEAKLHRILYTSENPKEITNLPKN